MKNILCTLLIAHLTLNSAFAASSVKDNVVALSKLGMGYEEHKIAGKNATEMFKSFLLDQTDEDEMVNKEINDMHFGDEVDAGFTSARSANEMSGFAISFLDDYLDSLQYEEEANANEIKKLNNKISEIKKGWSGLVKKLETQGVKFGYTGFGPGSCGMSYIEMIIVDEKEQKLYEVYLSEGGEC